MAWYNFECKHDDHPIIEVSVPMEDFDRVKDGTLKVHCPKCGSKMTHTIKGQTFIGYIAGSGWKDKQGAKRDMEKWTLMNNDPYGHMRQSGEVDHMLDQFEKAGSISGKKIDRKKAVKCTTFKVCPSCKQTLLETFFECGHGGKCINCTPEEKRTPAPLSEDDYNRILVDNITGESQKRRDVELKKYYEELKNVEDNNID